MIIILTLCVQKSEEFLPTTTRRKREEALLPTLKTSHLSSLALLHSAIIISQRHKSKYKFYPFGIIDLASFCKLQKKGVSQTAKHPTPNLAPPRPRI